MQGNRVVIGTQPAGFDQEVVELLQIPRISLEGMGRRPLFETEIAQKTSVIHDYRKNRELDDVRLQKLLTVNRPQSLLPLVDRRLFKSLAGTQFFENPGFLEFLLETLEGLVDGFVVFDVNFEHT